MVVSQVWVIDFSSGRLAEKQPEHWFAAGTALCSDSVMNYWPFNTHSTDSVSGNKERWYEKGWIHVKMSTEKRGLCGEQCKRKTWLYIKG